LNKSKKKFKKNILLTGGAGYIGSTVAYDLIKFGHNVTIIDNLSTGYKKLIPKKAFFYKTDINNRSNLKKLFKMKKFDLVMHFAAYIKVDESVKKPKKYYVNNFDKTKIFFNSCIDYGITKIIFSSTAAVYGNKLYKVKEGDKLLPKSPYAISKLMCEKFIIKRSNQKKCKYIILRYFNVAGSPKNLKTGLIAKKATHLIKKLCEFILGKKNNFFIYGNNYPTKDGTAIRDFIHVSDLSTLHILSMNYLFKSNKSQIFNCGYGKEHSVLEIVKAGIKKNKEKLKYKFGNKRKGDVGYAVADNTKIKKFLTFKPKYNNINLIIKSALRWERSIISKKFK
jgi:UDP-glucose 4-epimerase